MYCANGMQKQGCQLQPAPAACQETLHEPAVLDQCAAPSVSQSQAAASRGYGLVHLCDGIGFRAWCP